MIKARAFPPPMTAQTFQRSMVFIDGTNLFHRLRPPKLRLQNRGLLRLVNSVVGSRPNVRSYIYTTEPEFERAKSEHEAGFADELRIVFGEAVKTKDGYKEKGVDAMLVADLVYHAAVRNFEYAILVSADTDFAQALRRVEDFGCRTAVVGVCAEIPRLLRATADEAITLSVGDLIQQSIAKPRSSD